MNTISNDLKKTILIVEDYAPLRNSLSEQLEEDFTVLPAEDGEKAINFINTQKINLILLDLVLPNKINGFSVLDTLKSSKKTSSIPVIVISSLNEESQIEKALKNGANDFLIKPFSYKQLFYKVNNFMQLESTLKENIEEEITLRGIDSNDLSGDFAKQFQEKFEKLMNELIEDKNYSIKKIASEMAMSVATFERWVKKIYGITPANYITDLKLKRAELLLRNKAGSVSEVAYKLGFNTTSYFSYLFKKRFNISPSAVNSD